MLEQFIQSSITTFFAILQALILLVITGSFKLYWDVKILKKNMNAAFTKIRNLEKREPSTCENVEPSSPCSRESK